MYAKGDVLVVDANENCLKWHAEYSGALTLLWDASYDREVDMFGTGIVRVKS